MSLCNRTRGELALCQQAYSGTAQSTAFIQPSNSTFAYLSEENKNTNLKRKVHLNIHCSIIYNSQDMEATYLSIDR